MEPTRPRITATMVAMCAVGFVVAATALDVTAILWALMTDPSGELLVWLAYRVALLAACDWLLGRLARRWVRRVNL